jgi:hypothetical protein
VANIPDWRQLQIVPKAKYLGFMLGPAVCGDDFIAPFAKLRLRTKQIAASLMPPRPAAVAFNVRAVTVLGYVAQLSPPPPCTPLNLWCCNKVWRMPGSSLAIRVGYALDGLGLHRLQMPSLVCAAALVRTACDGKLDWSQPLAQLFEVASIQLPIRRARIDQLPWPGHWLQPPLAWFFARPAAGDPCLTPSRFLKPAISGAVTAGRLFLASGKNGSVQAVIAGYLRNRCLGWAGLGTEVSGRWKQIVGAGNGDIRVTDDDITRELRRARPASAPMPSGCS